MVQQMKLCTLNARGLGSIPRQGTRSHMPQLRILMLQLKTSHATTKIPRATTKTWHSQVNKYFFKKELKSLGTLLCLGKDYSLHSQVVYYTYNYSSPSGTTVCVCVCVCVYFEFQVAFLYSPVLLVFITFPVLSEVLIMGVLSGAPCLGDHRHPCLLGPLVFLLQSGLVSLQTCAQLLPWDLSLLF